MNVNDMPAGLRPPAETLRDDGADLLTPLLLGGLRAGPAPVSAPPMLGVLIGELLALTDTGATPLVRFAGQVGPGAVRARSVVDLHGAHIGAAVVLIFEEGDPARPIVMGVLRGTPGWPLPDKPAQVEVDADGQRLIVTAREQLVLRCGKASITLTKAGKVLIEGSYLLSRSTGVNRVKGGAVQLN
jgi:Domain of unknown function (DUF6484)